MSQVPPKLLPLLYLLAAGCDPAVRVQGTVSTADGHPIASAEAIAECPRLCVYGTSDANGDLQGSKMGLCGLDCTLTIRHHGYMPFIDRVSNHCANGDSHDCRLIEINAHLQPIAPPPNPEPVMAPPCRDGSSNQGDLNDCAASEARTEQDKLDSIIKQIHARHASNPAFLKKFDTAHAAWRTYLDAEVAARFPSDQPLPDYGSVYPMCLAQERASLLHDRIQDLQPWLTDPEEGYVCTGSYSLPSTQP